MLGWYRPRASDPALGGSLLEYRQAKGRERPVKFVIAWTERDGGYGAAREDAAPRALAAFANWTPPDAVTVHEFLARLDGTGGFSVVETDDPDVLLDGPTKFGPWVQFHIYPVTEMAVGARAAQAGVEFRAAIT